MYVVGVVGYSNLGKTTLLERLIPRLLERGLCVGAIKHASHGFDADRPGKDSDRIYRSGAAAVTLVSRNQLATFRRREESDVSLREALDQMPGDVDLAIVEGFAWESIPRFVLVREGKAPAPRHTEAGPVLGVVEVPEPAAGSQPCFDADVIEQLTGQLEEQVVALRAADRGKRLDTQASKPPPPLELAKEVI